MDVAATTRLCDVSATDLEHLSYALQSATARRDLAIPFDEIGNRSKPPQIFPVFYRFGWHRDA
jgi:hypothetical protein